MKEGTVGYNIIQVLKNPEFADLKSYELAEKVAELYGQETTAASVVWHINYFRVKKATAIAENNLELANAYTVVERSFLKNKECN